MAMKETVGSLRAYFILVGGFSALGSLTELGTLTEVIAPMGLTLLLWALALLSIGLSCGFVLAGIRLKRELLTGAGWIRTLLFACIAVLAVEFALTMVLLPEQLASWQIGWTVIHLAISVYLLSNLKRLSDDAISAQGVPPARTM